MLKARPAACVAAVLLSACGGGGGGDAPAPPPPPAAITPAEAVLTTARAVMDLTALAWALSFDVQNTLVLAPTQAVGSSDCPQGGRSSAARPGAALLLINYEACRSGGLLFAGRIEAQDSLVTVDTDGATNWGGTLRFVGFSVAGSERSLSVSATAVGSGRVLGGIQPLTVQFSNLQATRTPDALGRGATLGSAVLSVGRIPSPSGPRDLYELLGCVTFTAPGLNAELCVDAGSRIALFENIGTEQLTGRLRWNAGTPGGFDARLRATPGGPLGSTSLRVELDLDNNGSYEAVATLDRSTEIGLRL